MPSGLLYVISNSWIRDPETDIRPYKIGITKSTVDDRYYGLGLKMPGIFETLFAYKLDDYEKAEQFIHGILNKFRVNGEWFRITQKELDLIKLNCETMGGILVTDVVKDEINDQINIDQIDERKNYSDSKIIKEKVFSYENKEYIARLYKPKDNSVIYGGIFDGDIVCKNMKSIVREYLKTYGKDISTNDINTHKAVKILIDFLEKEK